MSNVSLVGSALLGTVLLASSTALAQPLTGPLIVPERGRPALRSDHPALCSEVHSLCVHAPDSRLSHQIAPVLEELDAAAIRLGRVMNWPTPLPDGNRGGSPAFDVYLDPRERGWLSVLPDTPTDLEFSDRASSFARMDPRLSGCQRRAALAEAFARAGLFGIDAGANHALAAASATYAASVVEACDGAFLSAIDEYQSQPWAAASQQEVASGRGAMLLPWFLQSTYGIDGSLDLLHALWGHGAQLTAAGTRRWVNDPDFIDVLRSFQKDRGAPFTDLMLEYAVSRAFMGDRDDGIHMQGTSWLGRAGRVRFENRIAWSSLPFWVRPQRPIEPTGAIYVWIDLKDVPAEGSLGVRAEWDTPAVFRFAALRIGSDGQEIGKLAPPTQERASSVEFNVEHLEGASALLLVGVNAGALAGEFQFDPDEMPPEPAGCMITLAAQR